MGSRRSQVSLFTLSACHVIDHMSPFRAVMAKARTTLLMSTLEADVDWVLWIDSDVEEISDTLFEDMLFYGNGGASGEKADEPMADVIAANVFKRRPHNKLQAYDLNK